MKYEIGLHSLQGARSSNQDRMAYAERDNAVFMVVADGLGGHAGGSIAAEILTKYSIQTFQSIKQSVIAQPSAFLAFTILQAHDQIVSYSKVKHPDIQPRTTCVLCLVQNGYAYWAHVGDSRLYHFRHDQVLERTLDHSSIEQMRQRGLIAEEEMRTHPKKSHITRCVGGNSQPEVTLGKETRLNAGDRLLLCSDGIWEAMEPELLISYMKQDPLEEGIEQMLHVAEDNMKQACDNITAIGLNWHDKATTTFPLQKLDTIELDSRKVLAKNKKKSKKKKVNKGGKKASQNASAKTNSKQAQAQPVNKTPEKKDVKQEIQDLEEYLEQTQKNPDFPF